MIDSSLRARRAVCTPSPHQASLLRIARISCLIRQPWILGWVAICLGGCAASPGNHLLATGAQHLAASAPDYGTTLQIRYLGAGGVLFQRGADSIMTAPFFSNPSLLRVGLDWRIEANVDTIDRFMRPIADDVRDTRAILVGHGHYDHLMDLPYIKKTYLPNARIYASDTATYILKPYPTLGPGDVVSVEHHMGDAYHSGKWWHPTRRIRFMALRSEHAPIIFHHKFVPGTYDAPLTEIPSTASAWREGQTLAYIIDFLNDAGEVDFRIHYQDAATTPTLGFPPDDAAAGSARVDVAVLCVPGFDQVDAYPEAIVLRLKPRFVVGIHWENFFEQIPDDPDKLHLVPSLDLDRFVARLNHVLPPDNFLMPAPGTWMQFRH